MIGSSEPSSKELASQQSRNPPQMHISIDHHSAFFLAHGGFATQIRQTLSGLLQAGVDAEYLRWWDENHRTDLLHFFGRPPATLIERCHKKKIPVVMSNLLTGQGSRSRRRLRYEGLRNRIAGFLAPKILRASLPQTSYLQVDAAITQTAWEAWISTTLYQIPTERVHIIPNGVEDIFFHQPNPSISARLDYLVCTATIHPRKRVLELAHAAIQSHTPVWIVGKPYSEDEEYYKTFLRVHKQHPDLVRYEGSVDDRSQLAQIYRQSLGFVLLSSMESQSLSAMEAVAAGCPLLLSDLPWARETFGDKASYCPVDVSATVTANFLTAFREEAMTSKQTYKALTWKEVGERLKTVYESLTPET